MKEIQIKTGANISSILQSTVNIPQAFTELVKNSIQNLATYIRIDIMEDRILIEDDGKGFNDVLDEKGKNDFDKYFVFGNSYDTTGGSGIRLGHMGIGGKLSNDKLSYSGAPDWSIHTRNKNNKAFIVNYKPGNNEFLDDYSPEISEINYDASLVNAKTGTLISINKINSSINQGVLNQVSNELKTFFGFLVSKLNSEGKSFEIILNGNSLDFDYRLPGTSFGKINKTFTYDLYGEEKTSEVEFSLAMVSDRSVLNNHPLRGVEIISEVKICNFSLSDSDLVQQVYDQISDEEGGPVDVQPTVLSMFSNLVGFISCSDLSTVLDDTGMPAKDLSHHGLRDDHPMTRAFLALVYSVVIELLREYLKIEAENRDEKFREIVAEITELLAASEDLDDDLLQDIKVEDRGKVKKTDVGRAAEGALNKMEFDPTEEKVINNKDWKDKLRDKNKRDRHEPEHKKILCYDILDFGVGFEEEMSRVSDFGSFKILINSGNEKFKKIDNDDNPLIMAMHISECLISEVAEFRDPSVSPKQIQQKISSFYNKSFDSMSERFKI